MLSTLSFLPQLLTLPSWAVERCEVRHTADEQLGGATTLRFIDQIKVKHKQELFTEICYLNTHSQQSLWSCSKGSGTRSEMLRHLSDPAVHLVLHVGLFLIFLQR